MVSNYCINFSRNNAYHPPINQNKCARAILSHFCRNFFRNNAHHLLAYYTKDERAMMRKLGRNFFRNVIHDYPKWVQKGESIDETFLQKFLHKWCFLSTVTVSGYHGYKLQQCTSRIKLGYCFIPLFFVICIPMPIIYIAAMCCFYFFFQITNWQWHDWNTSTPTKQSMACLLRMNARKMVSKICH